MAVPMGRFANSWELTKTSFRVASQDKELMLLPVLSFLAGILSFALVAGIGFSAGLFPKITDATGHLRLGAAGLMVVLYFLLAFVQTYFAAAVVAGASERLAGGNPTIGSSLRAANRRLGRLLGWSAISATVSIVLQIVRERGGLAGRIAAGLGNLAWQLATYFVIPILLFEEVGLAPSIGRSGSLFKKTWGEQVIGTGGVGLVFGLAFMLLIFVGVLLVQAVVTAGGPSGGLLAALPIIVVFVGLGIALTALQAVIQGVYKAALYRFATTGQAMGFTTEQLQGSFRPKA
jgi:hypothetical protein